MTETTYKINPRTGQFDMINDVESDWSQLTTDITSEFDIGNIWVWDVLSTWTTFEQFVSALLTGTFYPTYVAPTYSLTANIANWLEIWSSVNLTLTFNYNRWQILGKVVWWIRQPATEQDKRWWLATNYTIAWTDMDLVNTKTINPYPLSATQTFSWTIDYAEWPQPKDSEWWDYQTPLPAWSQTKTKTITAIHPYFRWVVADTSPTINQALISSGNKVVASSTWDITIDFNSLSNEFCWFAIPESSSAYDTWYVNALNNGTIWQPWDWFPTATIISVDSPDGYWTGVNYRVYVASYVSAVTDPVTFSTTGS